MNVGWCDAPVALWDLAKAIPMISGNGLPLLIENNFQTPLFYLDPRPPHLPPPPRLLIFRFLFIKNPLPPSRSPPLLFGTGEYCVATLNWALVTSLLTLILKISGVFTTISKFVRST